MLTTRAFTSSTGNVFSLARLSLTIPGATSAFQLHHIRYRLKPARCRVVRSLLIIVYSVIFRCVTNPELAATAWNTSADCILC